MAALPHLFSPISIGPMQLRNRLVMSAMTTNYGSAEFEVTERLIRYHEARARGGVGLITVEMCSVDVKQRYQLRSLCLGEDRFIAGHRELVDRVHALGAKIQPQISHPGPESLTDPVGPSVNVAATTGRPSRVLAVAEIEQIMDQYAAAAVRARQSGYDGMELHAAHAYMLLGSFLSTERNRRRKDDYEGGTLAGRSRMLLETLRRIKRAAGPDFPVTVRISGHEGSFDGRELNETQLLAPLLVAAGADCIQVTGGVSHDRLVAAIVRGAHEPDGHNVAVASAIRKVVNVPVMVVGRIHHPEQAETIIADGQADLVMMARPLLADPDLPRKAAAGQLRQIRRCLSCQNCIDSMLIAPFEANMNCAVNAFSGRETELEIRPAAARRKVVVIGAGTAGMEAARVAALRGHDVVLLERSNRLGGSLFLAATVHQDNQKLLDFLRGELQRLPIDVHLGHIADVASVQQLHPDAVVVATGARMELTPIAGSDQRHVFAAGQLKQMLAGALAPGELQRWPLLRRLAAERVLPAVHGLLTPAIVRGASKWYLPLGKQVCIVGGDLASLELAEFLADRGRRVTVLASTRQLAPEVGPKRRQEHLAGLDRLGVEIISGARATAIRRDAVVFDFEGHLGEVPADSVILAGEPVADTALYDQLRAVLPEVVAIGDCTGLGLIRKATEDAARAACEI